jgi:hypothetical protein
VKPGVEQGTSLHPSGKESDALLSLATLGAATGSSHDVSMARVVGPGPSAVVNA